LTTIHYSFSQFFQSGVYVSAMSETDVSDQHALFVSFIQLHDFISGSLISSLRVDM